MYPVRAAVLGMAIAGVVFGQTYTISTLAGGALAVNVPGTSVTLDYQSPEFVAADRTGNLFFTVWDQSVVLRLDATTGLLTRVAGNGTTGFSGDNGPAISAQLNHPWAVAVDSSGNLYIADNDNYRVRKVSNGIITTIAGNGTQGFSGDGGPAGSAQMSDPKCIAVDSSGNVYVTDSTRIRKISNGIISTVAGNGTLGFSGDNGQATSAQLNDPLGVAVDSAGNLYIADSSNCRIRKVTNGVITTVAGTGQDGFNGDAGTATSIFLSLPQGVAVDSGGTLYIADSGGGSVRKVASGQLTTVARQNVPAGAHLNIPTGVAVDSGGNVYIADIGTGLIQRLSNGAITTVVGNGRPGFSGDNGPAIKSQLAQPQAVAVDSNGNVYIADSENYRVRKVSNGIITTIAGTGTQGFSGDNGPATNAQLYLPYGIAVDAADNVYVSDNHRIRKISAGVITTIAGDGTIGYGGDNGPATNAQLYLPYGLAVDAAGSVYVADWSRIRKISDGVITTVAGNGTQGFSGDNGAATSAQLNFPYWVAVDSAGDLYIADGGNNRIRKVSGGVITTIAGNGAFGFSGDNGPATSASLADPAGIAVDGTGDLYIADLANNRIRKISKGVITTIAGTGMQGFSGDGTLAVLPSYSIPEMWRWTLPATFTSPISLIIVFVSWRPHLRSIPMAS